MAAKTVERLEREGKLPVVRRILMGLGEEGELPPLRPETHDI